MKKVELCVMVVILAIISFAVCGCEGKSETEISGPFEQKYIRGWGNIPKQNFCPHCGGASYRQFCTSCEKERGNLPFIGIYCPTCEPNGEYTSESDDINEICADCGGKRTWKYVYKKWQNKPDPNIVIHPTVAADGAIEIIKEPIKPNEPKIVSEPNKPKLWGQGDPPEDWQGFFGNDNISRLNFAQTQTVNRLGQATAELAERVRKLEERIDPNAM